MSKIDPPAGWPDVDGIDTFERLLGGPVPGSPINRSIGNLTARTKWLRENSLQAATLAAADGSVKVGFIQPGVGAVSRTVQSKLRERISILDFGAVGDNTTDNTEALQNAVNKAVASGKELFVPAGTYRTKSLTYSGPVQVVGEGIEKSVFRLTETTGTFLQPTPGVNTSYSLFQDFKVIGPGRDVAGGAVGFRFSEGAGINRSITFNRVWIEGFNLHGIALADSIACALRDVRLRSCGATTSAGGGPKGAGLHLYSVGVLSGSAAAIILLMDNCTISASNYGVATPDGQSMVYCSVQNSSFQNCNEGIRSIVTDDLLLLACYFEYNTIVGATIRNGFDIRTRALGAENAVVYSGTGVSITRDGVSVREGTQLLFNVSHAANGVDAMNIISGGIKLLPPGSAATAVGSTIFGENGDPQGTFTAPAGSLFLRRDASASGGGLFVKLSPSTSNTGWALLQTAQGGNTAGRPTPSRTGVSYFDTSLGKPLWWNGAGWVDATGAAV